jgi:hypothetical protein
MVRNAFGCFLSDRGNRIRQLTTLDAMVTLLKI